MAKDPAFLFYPGDWMGGTSTFSRFLKGAYMDVLMAQFNSGALSLEEIKTVLGSDFGQAWPTIQKKFTKTPQGLFFNERLQLEKEKRIEFTKSRSGNRKGKTKYHMNNISKSYEKTYDKHMENENEDKSTIKEKGGTGEKPKFYIGKEAQFISPSEWIKVDGMITLGNMKVKYKFTPDQWNELFFMFDLNQGDIKFTDENNLKNSFKKFCELRSKELSGNIQHHANGTPRSNISKVANF